jgi:hypothetical protein
MTYSTYLTLLVTTLASNLPEEFRAHPCTPAPSPLAEDLQPALQQILALVAQFRAHDPSPTATLEFEQQLQLHLRELGRRVVQHTYNALEPADVQVLPGHLHFQTGYYTRLSRKTAQNVCTLFGQIRLWRVGYRSTSRCGDPAIFPLTQALGLIEGATPALAGRAAVLFASTGGTQGQTRERLRQDHGVGWGVKKLRQVMAALAEMLAPQRHASQVERLLELLEQARLSRGLHKPVLSVGRDGITLGVRIKQGNLFEVATAATVSVFDRAGKRLGTVYLAVTPQPEQVRLSQELTRLVTEVLRHWEGPLPRLCYVSDAGKCETSYYTEVLSRMSHPRSGERLKWIRVLDYYHASQRLWTLAECLFGQGRQASAWVRKMQRWLLEPGGLSRVLHSAGAFRSRVKLSAARQQQYARAYRYLRKHRKYLRYAEYRRVGVPLGSGVTEAACKTLYTQRLKLSGMRWTKAGAQVVLDLRVLLVSEVWDRAFRRALDTLSVAKVPTREAFVPDRPVNAA